MYANRLDVLHNECILLLLLFLLAFQKRCSNIRRNKSNKASFIQPMVGVLRITVGLV